MSRSFKKNKIFGNIKNANSEKKDKVKANKNLRRLVRIRIGQQKETLPLIKEISNIWSFAKDGKHYWANAQKKDLSK